MSLRRRNPKEFSTKFRNFKKLDACANTNLVIQRQLGEMQQNFFSKSILVVFLKLVSFNFWLFFEIISSKKKSLYNFVLLKIFFALHPRFAIILGGESCMLNEIFAGFAFLIFSSIGKSPRVIISSFGGGSRGLVVQLYRLEVGILTFFLHFCLIFLGVWRRKSVQISWNHQKILPETSLLVKIKITLMKD